MPFEWSQIQGLVTAAATLGGVWLGSRLTSMREEAREDERNTKETTFLAIFVVTHLGRFANACLHVALDDGTEEGRPAGEGGCYAPTVTPPTFDPLALDVNWKALPAGLMYDILGLPDRIEALQHHVLSTREFDDPPDYTDFFWARQYGYAVLGLEVSQLAQGLRYHAALPDPPQDANAWDRDAQLRAVRDKISGERSAHERRTTEPVALPTN